MSRRSDILSVIHGAGYESQRHFAVDMGLKPSTLSDYINGQNDNSDCRDALISIGVSEEILKQKV